MNRLRNVQQPAESMPPTSNAAAVYYSTAGAYYATVTGEPTSIHPALRPKTPFNVHAEEVSYERWPVSSNPERGRSAGPTTQNAELHPEDLIENPRPVRNDVENAASLTGQMSLPDKHLISVLTSEEPVQQQKSLRRKPAFVRKPVATTVRSIPIDQTQRSGVQDAAVEGAEIRERKDSGIDVEEEAYQRAVAWALGYNASENEGDKVPRFRKASVGGRPGRRPSVVEKLKTYKKRCHEAWVTKI